MRMRIILVAGMPGAGKEELLTVARDMGLPFLRMGDLVREAYALSGRSDVSAGGFADEERRTKGKDIWARRAVERMSGDVFLVDGCRSMDEVRAYREICDDIVVLGIFASPAARYDRLVKRGREDAPRNVEEFEARDAREMGWGLSDVLALADVMVPNDRDLESFRILAAETLGGLL